jgi:hypothetical protein
MVRAIISATLFVLFAACGPMAAEMPSSAGERAWRKVDLYRAINGESYIPCSGREVLSECGEDLYARPPSEYDLLTPPSPERKWGNCSTDEVDCVLNYRYVMAVPKSDLRAGLTYKLRGAELRVEACFEALLSEFPTPCEVALISTQCVDDCGCLEEAEKDSGVLFYYSRKFGITAFFATQNIKAMQEIQPAYSWTLIADEGFLKMRIPPDAGP